MDFKHSGCIHSKIISNGKVKFYSLFKQKLGMIQITIEKFHKLSKSEPTFPPGSLN